LPWTHHPELGRALDGWLAAIIAITWFAWVRTLATEREDRDRLAWTILFAAAIVALVSFATQGIDPTSIYGLRPTAGWRGYGPFPNRNHTACFLAIGILAGAGVIVHAGTKKQFGLMSAGCVAAGVALIGLLRTQSRGGLVVLAVGAAIYLFLVVAKLRSPEVDGDRRGGLRARRYRRADRRHTDAEPIWSSNVTGDVSAGTRIEVWRNALTMWWDAPLFGHGPWRVPVGLPHVSAAQHERDHGEASGE
jgi:O-antigen ligase